MISGLLFLATIGFIIPALLILYLAISTRKPSNGGTGSFIYKMEPKDNSYQWDKVGKR